MKKVFFPTLTFFLLLLLYFLTTNQIFSFDAVTNAIACESLEPVRWFHPNHLFYPLLGVIYFHLEKMLGYGGLAIYSLARFNSILMALALAFLHSQLARRKSAAVSFFFCIFLGVSYSFWHYAVDGRAIGTVVIFYVLLIAFLLRLEEKKHVDLKSAIGLAFLSALAVFSHGIAVFHIIAVAYFLYRLSPENRGKFGLSSLYVLSASSLILGVYFGVYSYLKTITSTTSFLNWSLGYAGFSGSEGIMKSRFWGSGIGEVAHGLWTGWRDAFILAEARTALLSSLFGILIIMLMGSSIGYRWLRDHKLPPLTIAFLWWGLLETIFIAFWSPGQEGFRLHVIIPWAIAVFLTMPMWKFMAWIPAAFSIFLFYVNFTFSIYPSAFIQNNDGFQMLAEVRSHLNPDDLLLTATNQTIPNFEVLRPYFFPSLKGGTIKGRLFAFRETTLDPLSERLRSLQKEGHEIYVSEDVLDPEVGLEIEQSRQLPKGEFERFVRRLEIADFFTLRGGEKIYRLSAVR